MPNDIANMVRRRSCIQEIIYIRVLLPFLTIGVHGCYLTLPLHLVKYLQLDENRDGIIHSRCLLL